MTTATTNWGNCNNPQRNNRLKSINTNSRWFYSFVAFRIITYFAFMKLAKYIHTYIFNLKVRLSYFIQNKQISTSFLSFKFKVIYLLVSIHCFVYHFSFFIFQESCHHDSGIVKRWLMNDHNNQGIKINVTIMMMMAMYIRSDANDQIRKWTCMLYPIREIEESRRKKRMFQKNSFCFFLLHDSRFESVFYSSYRRYSVCVSEIYVGASGGVTKYTATIFLFSFSVYLNFKF